MMEPDLQELETQLEAATRDAESLTAGLSEAQGAWRVNPDSWSVAECLDHLASFNRVYLAAMQDAAVEALRKGRTRRGVAKPGLLGRWVLRMAEPPVKPKSGFKAPESIKPAASRSLRDACNLFVSSQEDVNAFLEKYAGLDLATIRFVNPFIKGVRFSLATGLHMIAAHDRRHLWQARRVREMEVSGQSLS